MKNFFAALLAIPITAALAGCGKNAGGQTAEGTVPETVTTVSEMPAEAVSYTEKTTEAAESITENYTEPENIFADHDESRFPMG